MNDIKDDGGAAFPGILGSLGYGNSTWSVSPNGENIAVEHNQGMTLRDWFAGQMAPALMQSAAESFRWDKRDNEPTIAEIVSDAYRYADFMILQRDAPGDVLALAAPKMLKALEYVQKSLERGEKIRADEILDAIELATGKARKGSAE